MDHRPGRAGAKGRGEPARAGGRRDRADRGIERRAQRRHPQALRRGSRAASGELPDGPFEGVPFLLKDLGAAFAGQPLHMGMQLLKDADFRAPVDTYLALRFRQAGFVTIGKTNTPELGHPADHRAEGVRAQSQPVGRRPAPPAGRAGARRRRSPPGWCRSPTPTTAAARSGSRRSMCGLVGLKPTRGASPGPTIGDINLRATVELGGVDPVGPRHGRDARRRCTDRCRAIRTSRRLRRARTPRRWAPSPAGCASGCCTEPPLRRAGRRSSPRRARDAARPPWTSLGHSGRGDAPRRASRTSTSRDSFLRGRPVGGDAGSAGERRRPRDRPPTTSSRSRGRSPRMANADSGVEYLPRRGVAGQLVRQVRRFMPDYDLLLTPTLGPSRRRRSAASTTRAMTRIRRS